MKYPLGCVTGHLLRRNGAFVLGAGRSVTSYRRLQLTSPLSVPVFPDTIVLAEWFHVKHTHWTILALRDESGMKVSPPPSTTRDAFWSVLILWNFFRRRV